MRPGRIWLTVMVSSILVTGVTVGMPMSPAVAGPSIGSLAGAGERPGATRLVFAVGDSVRAQVDVGSGNLLLSVRGLTLPDVNRQVQVGAFYNSQPLRLRCRGWVAGGGWTTPLTSGSREC